MTTACHAWRGWPDEHYVGLICTLPRNHAGEHIANAGSTECGRWPNNLDKMTRIESSRAMAAYVGASEEQINEAEAAGRQEARTGITWAKQLAVRNWQEKPMEALQFLYMEARQDELSKMPEKTSWCEAVWFRSGESMRILNAPVLTSEERHALDGVPVLDPDSLDKAILGAMPNASGELVLVYGYDELVQVFAEDVMHHEPEGTWSDPTGLEHERTLYDDAEEWVDNTLRALPCMGPRAPVILRRVDDPDEIDPEELIEFKNKKWVKAPACAALTTGGAPIQVWDYAADIQPIDATAALREQVATLTRERDEARAEVERLRDLLAAGEERRVAREQRLRSLGFDEPSPAERLDQLARNMHALGKMLVTVTRQRDEARAKLAPMPCGHPHYELLPGGDCATCVLHADGSTKDPTESSS